MSEELKHSLFTPTDCLSEETMFDYIDNKLTPKERNQVEKHLLDCELCSDAMEGLELLKNRNRIANINQEIDKRMLPVEKKEAKVISINYKLITAIAASLLLLVGAIIFFTQFGNKQLQENDVAVLTQTPPPAEDTKTKTDTLLTVATGKEDENKQLPLEKDQQDKPIAALENKSEKVFKNKLSEEGKSLSYKISTLKPATEVDKKPDNTPIATNGTTTKLLETEKAIDETKELSKAETKSSVTYSWNAANTKQSTEKNNSVINTDTKKGAATKTSNNRYHEETGYKKTDAAKDVEQTQSPPITVTTPAKTDSSQLDGDKTVNTVAFSQPTTKVSKKKSKEPESPAVANETVSAGDRERKIKPENTDIPMFPGGRNELNNFITSNFNYSLLTDKWNPTDGTIIIVGITVDSTGAIINPKITKGISTELNNEALRVVNSMPKWIPAKRNNSGASVQFNFPNQTETKNALHTK